MSPVLLSADIVVKVAQPKEILITSAKRLLQQNLPKAAVSRCSK
jgi:hypothetical protein